MRHVSVMIFLWFFFHLKCHCHVSVVHTLQMLSWHYETNSLCFVRTFSKHYLAKESYHLSWLLVLWSKFNCPCSKFVYSYWKIVAKALRNQVATDKETFWCWSDWAALHPSNTMTCHTVILSCMCSKSIVLNLWYDSGKEKEL